MILDLNTGWIDNIKQLPSPFYNPRPDYILKDKFNKIDLLVIHSISLPRGEYLNGYIEDLFLGKIDLNLDPSFQSLKNSEVSSHFLINRKGEIIQFVSCFDRAWHAGQSEFKGRENCNDFSIGIELEGVDDDLFEKKQYDSLIQLTQTLSSYFIQFKNKNNIQGHSDIAPGRKTDPGIGFDWVFYLQNL